MKFDEIKEKKKEDCPTLARLLSEDNFTINMVNEEEYEIIKKFYREIDRSWNIRCLQ